MITIYTNYLKGISYLALSALYLPSCFIIEHLE